MNVRTALTVTQLGISMAVGTFLVFVLGVLAPFLVDDLSLSAAQVGALPTAFFLAAALSAQRAGAITDRIGSRRSILLLDLLVATALVLLAAAGDIRLAVFAAFIGGVATALANPATNRVVAAAVPAGAHGLAMGIKQAGVPMGAVLAGALLPTTAETWGWRTAALVAAGLPLLDAFLTGVSRHEAEQAPPASVLPSAARIRGDDGLRRLRAFAFFLGGANALLNAFLVLFASSELSFSRAVAGLLTAAMGVIAVLMRVGWAHLGERRAAPQSLLVTIGVLGSGSSVLIVSSEWFGSWSVWVAALLAGGSVMAFHGVMNLLIVRIRPGADIGRASGFVLRGFFSGLLVTPLLFGAIVDLSGTYAWVWAGQAVLCLAATATAARWAVRVREPMRAAEH